MRSVRLVMLNKAVYLRSSGGACIELAGASSVSVVVHVCYLMEGLPPRCTFFPYRTPFRHWRRSYFRTTRAYHLPSSAASGGSTETQQDGKANRLNSIHTSIAAFG